MAARSTPGPQTTVEITSSAHGHRPVRDPFRLIAALIIV